MSSDLDVGITLAALAPFFAAALAPFIHRFTKSYAGWILAVIPASIFIYLLSFVEQMSRREFVSAGFEWIPSYGIRLSFYLDGLSVTFALLISGIGTFIILYSAAYLSGHKHLGRFLSFMLLFMGSMLGLVLSDNLISLFVFWELTSITSFLLIGFDHVRQASRRAAIQALVITGGGGLALLAGILLLHQITNQWDISEIFVWGSTIKEMDIYPLVLGLFLLGAFTKSAQFPFHFWLPNAMEAPTPVSAYLHSATMVKAGIYLLMRMNPVLGGTTEWNIILPIVGGFTLLWGAAMAMKQTDLKQMLAQTT
ncbi:MAG: Na(+)/H(+) antiporter subunit A, partial [Devosiaceae bacterium]|nr:Na(+)/H(+) antiporter subunit A [Devosiaceae bacterium]